MITTWVGAMHHLRAPWFCPMAYGYCGQPAPLFEGSSVSGQFAGSPAFGWSLPRALFPVDVMSLLPALHSYPDQQFAQYIEEGLQFGFRIGFYQAHPLRSCLGNHWQWSIHAVVWEHIRTEVSLVGPFPPLAAELSRSAH